jgi:hypothetical protein
VVDGVLTGGDNAVSRSGAGVPDVVTVFAGGSVDVVGVEAAGIMADTKGLTRSGTTCDVDAAAVGVDVASGVLAEGVVATTAGVDTTISGTGDGVEASGVDNMEVELELELSPRFASPSSPPDPLFVSGDGAACLRTGTMYLLCCPCRCGAGAASAVVKMGPKDAKAIDAAHNADGRLIVYYLEISPSCKNNQQAVEGGIVIGRITKERRTVHG